MTHRFIKDLAAVACVVGLFVFGGCRPSQEPATSGWHSVAEAEMSPEQSAQRDKALAARDAMLGDLKQRLMEALSADDAAGAINVCSTAAPQIAAEVGRQQGVSIGRTSFRLRNPANAPPSWAEELVQQRVEDPVYLSDGQQLAALLPIRLQAMCVICHGPQEKVLPEVEQALREHYPDDQATGFEPGELRGWFWVEVPPAEEAT